MVVNSRFIATLAPVFSIGEARDFIKHIKNEFADASHNVPVYIIGGGNTVTEYFSDDGEPPGTSGRPALAVLRGSGLGDAALVITRYFGGTLLGTGGLVKAYTESAQMVVNRVGRGKRVTVNESKLVVPYNLLERIRLLAALHNGVILAEDFGGDVTLTMQIPSDQYEEFELKLGDLSAGKAQTIIIETKERILPD